MPITVNVELLKQLMPKPRFIYTLTDLSEVTGLSKPFIYKEWREGRLTVSSMGGRHMVTGLSLLQWLEGLPEAKIDPGRVARGKHAAEAMRKRQAAMPKKPKKTNTETAETRFEKAKQAAYEASQVSGEVLD
jgi:hypothetical protein